MIYVLFDISAAALYPFFFSLPRAVITLFKRKFGCKQAAKLQSETAVTSSAVPVTRSVTDVAMKERRQQQR